MTPCVDAPTTPCGVVLIDKYAFNPSLRTHFGSSDRFDRTRNAKLRNMLQFFLTAWFNMFLGRVRSVLQDRRTMESIVI